jgi:hypothetical protein
LRRGAVQGRAEPPAKTAYGQHQACGHTKASDSSATWDNWARLQHARKARRYRLVENWPKVRADLRVLIQVGAYSYRLGGMFVKVGFHLGFALRICIQ